MDITEARAIDLTDTTGAALMLDCSVETIRQLVFKKQLRCFCFMDGVLTEVSAKGRSALFLRDDIEKLPPRVWGWPAGKPRKKIAHQEVGQ